MKGSLLGKFVPRLFLILLGAASLSGVEVSPDHRKIEPFLLVTDEHAVVAAQRKMLESTGSLDTSVPVFIHTRSDDPDLPARLGNLGGNGKQVHSRLFTGRIPRDASRYISNWAHVAYIESAKLARPLLDFSGTAVSADDVHTGTGLPSTFTGAGMNVGVVDTGLHVAHLDFHIGGGPQERVNHWYPDNNVTARTDTDGHGTHVTGIAAGNGFSSGGTYTGMAPGANILFGKTSFQTTDIVTAVQNLVSFSAGPIAVNLSLGSMLGPHDNTSGFESGINSIAANTAGVSRIITVAAGNEGDANEHFQATIAPFDIISTSVNLKNVSRNFFLDGETLQIWGDGNDAYTVSITLGSDSITVPAGGSGTSAGGIIVSDNVAQPPNGASFISIFFPSGGGTANLQLRRTRNGGTGRINAYINDTDGTFNVATISGNTTEPANAPAVLAVGSFNTKSFSDGTKLSENISSFSSRGPTRDDRLKPDITAPGFVVYSARSFDRSWIDEEIAPNPNYVIMAGTSMSSPHVAGIAALVWQSNPTLSSAGMRERIKRTANTPTDGSATPNATWGFGKVNALAAIRNSVASITAPTAAIPGTAVNMTSENSSGAFGSPLASFSWSLVQQPTGSGLTLSSTAQTASFTPVVPGNYTVGLTVAQTTPSGTPPGSATALVHVNNVPDPPLISGPASADNLAPVNFAGSGTDPDGQQLSFRWVLVSRPAGSASTITTANVTNVTLSPDVAGTYEVGLKVDDGLDNSALAIHSFSGSGTAPPASGGGGGGGGCSVARGKDSADPHESMAAIIILLLPAGVLAVRRRFIIMKIRSSSRIPPPGRPGAL